MNNFQKAVMLLVVIVTIQASAKPGPNAAFSQTNKSTTTSTKTETKHFIIPNRARNFLNGIDMPTRAYVDTWAPNKYGRYEADSDRLILESRDPNRFLNNLSYSVFGDKYVAKAVELDLAVNDLSHKTNSIGELIKYSDFLMYKVTGKHLTPEIKKSMLTKVGGEWAINGYKIKIETETFPDEKVIKGVEPTSDHGAFSLTFLIEL